MTIGLKQFLAWNKFRKMQNKKILFLCPNVFGLYRIFQAGLEKYSGCDVTVIIYKKYKYRNRRDHIKNFFSKVFLGKNLKKVWASKSNFESLDPNDRFDYALTICPDLLDLRSLQHIRDISDNSIVYYWDGFDHFPAYKKTVPFFDKCYSFDPYDAKTYGLIPITNFYFAEDRNNNTKTDLFFLSSYDSRYPIIEKIVNEMDKQGKNIKVLQYSRDKKKVLPRQHSNSITFIKDSISFEETTQLMKDTTIVLDIQKEIQRGLTFRVFEAMGLGKKLITTNPDIVHYDFYNPNNIFIWTENTNSIPENFLNTPYEELPEEIYKKYSQESWVKKILEL